MIHCYYCKAIINAIKDHCRCCGGALGIFKCPGCCGFMDVRCHREGCAKKACEEKVHKGGGVGKDAFSRDHCASCSCVCAHDKCTVKGEEIICIECGDLQDDRYRGVVSPEFRVVCHKKHEHA